MVKSSALCSLMRDYLFRYLVVGFLRVPFTTVLRGREYSLLAALSMEDHNPSTFLSMDSGFLMRDELEREVSGSFIHVGPPDINLPISMRQSPPPLAWNDPSDILEVCLAPQAYEQHEVIVTVPKLGRKSAKRLDSIWSAWFFFSFYFRPVLSEKSKSKIVNNSDVVSGFEKSDLQLDAFLVQHDMENIYMWVFKERPENALGKMQLRSYMNGHSRQGERPFPFSVERGFVRSHRMQRKHYRGLSNPQCVHGIEVVHAPNLSNLSEEDRKRWMELTGRDINLSIPPEASDYGSWRNLSSSDLELERPLPPEKTNGNLQPHKFLNGCGLNLSSQPSSDHSNGDVVDLSPVRNKRKRDLSPNGEDFNFPNGSCSDRGLDLKIHNVEPSWFNDFNGVMKNVHGPVTAAKAIYEDEQGFLIVISLPFIDLQTVKVTWKNTDFHGVVKVSCVSTACTPFIKRHDRTFKLTDPMPEHCPPGEFIREIPLPTRIPEDAKLEAYCDQTGTVLEINVPKHHLRPEEHEVRVCFRPSAWSD
ncbi:hypothetical protein MLD38_009765 [Melastoma candidum]|uniref:Uncharacterized protein n=1 Tax=Melastoma candidum TaxID=119954 RepID=A0ACB9S2Y2_9MYRT|nr:hypothetical protein MLD38_009765 [Melastoma candidum]